MRVALVLAATLALAAPATAAATPFGELPFRSPPDPPACLRATGAPGELIAWTAAGARLWQATPGGLVAGAAIGLGAGAGCPATVSQPDGAAVTAAHVGGDDAPALAIALREPGAAGFGAPISVAAGKGAEILHVIDAVSPRGDAIVVWSELAAGSTRLRTVRRAAGGAFGAPATLAKLDGEQIEVAPVAGIAADGAAVVAWRDSPDGAHAELALSSAAPGGRFSAAKTIVPQADAGPALAVAPDGHALLVYETPGSVELLERPRGGTFGSAQRIGAPAGFGRDPAVALAADGSALVAWGDGVFGDLEYVRRGAGQPFGPPIAVLTRPAPREGLTEDVVSSYGGTGANDDADGAALRIVTAPDGRVELAWIVASPLTGRGVARAAIVAPDGTAVVQPLGGPLRAPADVAPVLLASGGLGVAWGDGRLHLALAGAEAARQAPFPAVKVRTPRTPALREADTLVLPISCSAACDLLATVHGLSGMASLAHAGTAHVRIRGAARAATLRGGPVKLTVLSGPPGARTAHTTTATIRLRRIPTPPVPVHARPTT